MYKSQESKKAYDLAYRMANRDKINARRRAKYASDPETRERVRKTAQKIYQSTGREYSKRYRTENRERIRKYCRARAYGLSVEQFDTLLSMHGEACALCETRPEDTPQKMLAVDHSHDDGRIRGFLCQQCNTDLGVIEKRRHQLNKFLEYADSAHITPPTPKSGGSRPY